MPADPDSEIFDPYTDPIHRRLDRDRFALAAMAAMLDIQPPERVNPHTVAEVAYNVADAILAERDKEGG